MKNFHMRQNCNLSQFSFQHSPTINSLFVHAVRLFSCVCRLTEKLQMGHNTQTFHCKSRTVRGNWENALTYFALNLNERTISLDLFKVFLQHVYSVYTFGHTEDTDFLSSQHSPTTPLLVHLCWLSTGLHVLITQLHPHVPLVQSAEQPTGLLAQPGLINASCRGHGCSPAEKTTRSLCTPEPSQVGTRHILIHPTCTHSRAFTDLWLCKQCTACWYNDCMWIRCPQRKRIMAEILKSILLVMASKRLSGNESS